MPDLYTDADIQAACRQACPCGNDAHDPAQYQECAWALTCTRLVLEAVAPAIAARALREAAEEHRSARKSSQEPMWPSMLDLRADEIERGA